IANNRSCHVRPRRGTMINRSRALRYFSFRGRDSRRDFWRTFLVLQVSIVIVWCLGMIAILALGRMGGAVMVAGIVAYIVAALAWIARRLNDRGRNAWWSAPIAVGPFALAAAGVHLTD